MIPVHLGACVSLLGRGICISECGWRLCLCPGICPPGQAPDLLGLAEEEGREPAGGPQHGDSSEWVFPRFAGVWRAGWLEFHIVSGDGALGQPPPSLGLSSFGPWHSARLMGAAS